MVKKANNKKPKINAGKILGIDLGTTNSVVTLYDADKEEYIPIPSLEGNPIIPSVFYLKEGLLKVGDKAREMIKTDPEHTIVSVKSQMDNPRHRFVLKDAYEGGDIEYSPIDVSSYVLRYIKKCAESHIGGKVNDVVITVPAYFKEVERKATKRACERAGLNLLELINEPTAACLAYGFANHKGDEEKNILVYDLGGGTFDISLLTISPDIYEVVDTDGEKVGGDDFDLELMKLVKQEVDTGKATEGQIKLQCEEAKKLLSKEDKVEVSFEIYDGGKGEITKKEFEKQISPLVNRTIKRVLTVMENHPEVKVDEVVLVGGSTRIPLVRKRLLEILDLKEEYFDKYKIDPDLAVSIGACIRGRIILGDTDIFLIDRTPFDIGVELGDGNLDPLIDRGSIIPTMGHGTYALEEGKEVAIFRVYQGNNPIARDNQYLGQMKFKVDSIMNMETKFKVTFSLSSSGVLSVEVTNILTGETQKVEVTGVVD